MLLCAENGSTGFDFFFLIYSCLSLSCVRFLGFCGGVVHFPLQVKLCAEKPLVINSVASSSALPSLISCQVKPIFSRAEDGKYLWGVKSSLKGHSGDLILLNLDRIPLMSGMGHWNWTGHKVVHGARLRTVFSCPDFLLRPSRVSWAGSRSVIYGQTAKPGICNLSSWSSNCLKHYGKKWPLFPREENLGAINNV